MRDFLKSNSGSVSIYFMIIFIGIFMFNTVLIDFARIKIADLQSEKIIRSSIRSILSSYDGRLQTYGLYTFTSEEDALKIFQEVYEENLSYSKLENTIQLSSLVLNSFEISGIDSLANEDIFQRQILEEMKYRAPIEFVLSVLEPFQQEGLSDDLKGTSTFSKQAGDIEKLIIDREKNLDSAWLQIQQILGSSGKIGRYYHYYDQQFNEIHHLAGEIGVKQVDEIRQEMKNLQQDVDNYRHKIDVLNEKKEKSETETEKVSFQSKVNKYKQWLNEIKDRIYDLETLVKKIEQYAETILITELQLNKDYEQLIGAQTSINSNIQKALKVNDELVDKLENEKIMGGEYISTYDRTYFRKIESEIGVIISLFSGMKSQFDSKKLLTGSDYIIRHQKLLDANERVLNYGSEFYSKQFFFENKRMDNNAKIKDQKDEQRQKTENQLKQIAQLLHSCNDTEQPIYGKLEDYKEKYDQFNQIKVKESMNSSIDLKNGAEDIGKQSMSIVDKLSAALLSVRDEVYMNEFALSKFNYRTYEDSNELSDPKHHTLFNQEVEYILYGFNHCELNQSSAFSEIFLLRLAIRTMEALSDPEQSILKAGSPLLSFLWAIAEGATKAYNDMQKLISGEEVKLSQKLSKSISLDYKDYLRVFLFLHSNDSNMISRMLSLIELNTNQDLTLKLVSVEASVETSIGLWFIPRMMEMLSKNVRGDEIIMNKTIFFTY
ncbi:DUF5702 domain-containing protein [Chengkuizengella marina]|uniref:DUF5702 domain-containing protein n=1 Tax=Chengkuizengella marina TaxID=2507566 RepID=UPI001369E1AD|nr:DUF5702 domain-containing protein [Chengkuizengella marina]